MYFCSSVWVLLHTHRESNTQFIQSHSPYIFMIFNAQIKNDVEFLLHEAISLLQNLIRTPSYSEQEEKTAELLAGFFQERSIAVMRDMNNVCCYNLYYDERKPTILLNSHHDTVLPNTAYTQDPFHPHIDKGKLYGLGSNDAGGCLVSLIGAFLYFYPRQGLPCNLLLAATAEEENSGTNGLARVYPTLENVVAAIVGEPTCMNVAIAEKGLLVLDCLAKGKAGHAARDNGVNAIYKVLTDIDWLRSEPFPDVSQWLGKLKMSVTVVKAGNLHNVIPHECYYTVDIRTTDIYSNNFIYSELQKRLNAEVNLAINLRPSYINQNHPLVKAAVESGAGIFGSSTTSDQALIEVPSIKIGPGDSQRSHTADEFIYISEIEHGILQYIQLLEYWFKNEVV